MSDYDQRRNPVPVAAVLTIGTLILAAVAVGALEWATAPGPQPVADAGDRPPLAKMIPGSGGAPKPETPGPVSPGAPLPAGETGPMPREVTANP